MKISNRSYTVSPDFQTLTDEFGTVYDAADRNEFLEWAGHGDRITPTMRAEADAAIAARQATATEAAAAVPDEADDPFQPSGGTQFGDSV